MSITAEVQERIEQEQGGVPTAAVWAEVGRLVKAAEDGNIIFSSLTIKPAEAEDRYSLLNTGEFVFNIDTVQHDEVDGDAYRIRTAIGASGEIYEELEQ